MICLKLTGKWMLAEALILNVWQRAVNPGKPDILALNNLICHLVSYLTLSSEHEDKLKHIVGFVQKLFYFTSLHKTSE